MALVIAIGALVPVGCREEYRTGQTTKATASGPVQMGSWRFELSEPWGPMYLPAWLPSLSRIKQNYWPFGLAGAYKLAAERTPSPSAESQDWPGRIGVTWHSDPFMNKTIRARLATLNGRRFFFVSAPVPPRPKGGPPPPPGSATAPQGGALHWLGVLDVDNGLVETFLLPEVPVPNRDGPLEWDAVPFKDSVTVVYLVGDSIYTLVGTLSHGEMSFSKPQLAHKSTGEKALPPPPVESLRLRATPQRLYVLWCQQMELLLATADEPGAEWSGPVTISTTANCSTCDDGADIVADGPDVFVAWSDNRLHGKFDKAKGYDNDLKLFIASSSDGGASFSQPALFSDPLRKEVEVDRVFLTLSEDKVVVCWTENSAGKWLYGLLDRGVTTMEVAAATLDDRKLLEGYTTRMKRQLGEVPYTPPRLPTMSKRPSGPGMSD